MTLPAIPGTFAETRRSLHLVLFYAVSKARQEVDGEVWSVPYPGGFGTPPGPGRMFRVDLDHLVEEFPSREVKREPIATLEAAMAFCGVEFDRARGERNDVEVPERTDEELSVDPAAASVIAAWFDVGWEVLGRVLERAPDADGTERRLWNEHFDLAIEIGSEEEHRRAAVGFSPGDEAIEEPYAYVAPWFKDETAEALGPTHPFGVAIAWSEVEDAPDPEGEIERFLVGALRRIRALPR